MNLLLLTFGDRAENHHQAAFCILSFLKDPCIGRVLVMTDRPAFYTWLQAGAAVAQGEGSMAGEGRERSAAIEVLPISADTLQDWQGPQQFFWRIKIKAVEHALQRHPDQHLVYVDSDTFLATDLSALQAGLDAGQVFMHCRENALADRNSRTLTRMRRALVGQTLAGVPFDGQTEMWNAGVVALPAAQSRALVDHALRLCDALCATACPRRLVEQLAFSVALKGSQGPQPVMVAPQVPGTPGTPEAPGAPDVSEVLEAPGAREALQAPAAQVTGRAGGAGHHGLSLQPCSRWIVHYWGNKPGWNAFIGHFLAESRLRNETVAQAVARAAAADWQHLPTASWPRSTAERLKRLIDRLWPRYRVQYFTPD